MFHKKISNTKKEKVSQKTKVGVKSRKEEEAREQLYKAECYLRSGNLGALITKLCILTHSSTNPGTKEKGKSNLPISSYQLVANSDPFTGTFPPVLSRY